MQPAVWRHQKCRQRHKKTPCCAVRWMVLMITIGSSVLKFRRKMASFIRLDDDNERQRHYAKNRGPSFFFPLKRRRKMSTFIPFRRRERKADGTPKNLQGRNSAQCSQTLQGRWSAVISYPEFWHVATSFLEDQSTTAAPQENRKLVQGSRRYLELLRPDRQPRWSGVGAKRSLTTPSSSSSTSRNENLIGRLWMRLAIILSSRCPLLFLFFDKELPFPNVSIDCHPRWTWEILNI